MSGNESPSLALKGSNEITVRAREEINLRFELTANKLNGFVISVRVGNGNGDLVDAAGFNKVKVLYRIGEQGTETVVPKSNTTLQDNVGFWSVVRARLSGTITVKLANVKAGEGISSSIVVTGYVTAGFKNPLPPCEFTIVKEQSPPPPELTSFVANPVVFDRNSRTTLSWTVNRSGEPDYRLILSPQSASSQPSEFPATSSSSPVRVADTTDFTLKIVTSSDTSRTSLNERTLRVFAKGHSGFDSYEFEGGKVVGVYADDKAKTPCLYALIRDESDQPAVSLWCSNNPFDSASWRKLGTPPLSMNQARCPGIVWQGRLWLMGGDSCDPDFERRSNSGAFEVLSLDLEHVGEGFVRYAPAGKGTPWPSARMGHAIVAPDNERLWVIGGWRPDGGVQKDLWEFRDWEWTQSKETSALFQQVNGTPLPGCCMPSVTATNEEVWVAGGFTTSPGGVPNDAALWVYDGQAWVARDAPEYSQPGYKYCTCTLFTRDNVPFGIWCYVKAAQTVFDYKYQLVRLGDARKSAEIQAGELSELSGDAISYHLSSTVFSRSIFMRSLRQNDEPLKKNDAPLNRKINFYYLIEGI
jgi:hypothetical protein